MERFAVMVINDAIDNLKQQGYSVKGVSDGWHTFDELYEHRRILTAILAKTNTDISWRARQHHDGEVWDDLFIVGFSTPEGQYSYHYKNEFWEEFEGVKELERAPEYDGHKPKDIKRLYSIIKKEIG